MKASLMIIFTVLTGCMANDGLRSAAVADNNTYGLSRLTIGMKESQVLAIMRHPYSKKTVEYNGNVYDVWYYVTRGVGLDQSRLVPQNLTPLTFENGMLMGWGFDYYHYVLKQQKPKSSPSSEKRKGGGLEKDLNHISMSSPPKKGNAAEADEDADSYLDDEGDKMIEDENDQNFNFW